jgi:hypothetical protein
MRPVRRSRSVPDGLTGRRVEEVHPLPVDDDLDLVAGPDPRPRRERRDERVALVRRRDVLRVGVLLQRLQRGTAEVERVPMPVRERDSVGPPAEAGRIASAG